jgi:hypothetical protein
MSSLFQGDFLDIPVSLEDAATWVHNITTKIPAGHK